MSASTRHRGIVPNLNMANLIIGKIFRNREVIGDRLAFFQAKDLDIRLAAGTIRNAR